MSKIKRLVRRDRAIIEAALGDFDAPGTTALAFTFAIEGSTRVYAPNNLDLASCLMARAILDEIVAAMLKGQVDDTPEAAA
jgi:hypothetical protein